MGGGRWTSSTWDSYKSTTMSTSGINIDKDSHTKVFTSRSMPDGMDPKTIKVRESVSSIDNPNPTPIIIGLDQTGSMGNVISECMKQLDSFITNLYNKKPVTDPQLCFMAVGDMHSNYEKAPLQVTQFESDIRIAEQLHKLYIEGSGGGNDSESYIAPWYFAATKTKIDSYDKSKKKGWLITVGDEECPSILRKSEIKYYIDPEYSGEDLTASELHNMVSKYYNVFHVVVKQGHHCQYAFGEVKNSWTKVLGQKVIYLEDVTKLSDVLIATLQMYTGMTKEEVLKDWDGSTSLATISSALNHLGDEESSGGLVAL